MNLLSADVVGKRCWRGVGVLEEISLEANALPNVARGLLELNILLENSLKEFIGREVVGVKFICGKFVGSHCWRGRYCQKIGY